MGNTRFTARALFRGSARLLAVAGWRVAVGVCVCSLDRRDRLATASPRASIHSDSFTNRSRKPQRLLGQTRLYCEEYTRTSSGRDGVHSTAQECNRIQRLARTKEMGRNKKSIQEERNKTQSAHISIMISLLRNLRHSADGYRSIIKKNPPPSLVLQPIHKHVAHTNTSD